MRAFALVLILSVILAACGPPTPPPPPPHAPEFALRPFEPFNRTDAVAIALREWRLFGQPVADEASSEGPEPPAADKPERQPGLWQRVGEYWWIGLDPRAPEVRWTGKHDAGGAVFPASEDGRYAWSAAFISYVMRLDGARDRFPYSATHAIYVNAAAAGKSPILRAHPPEAYAPKLGDLICLGRGSAQSLTYADLPTSSPWPGHCAIVVEVTAGSISVVGGNVGDAVALTHVPVTPDGMLADSGGVLVDQRHRWFVVLEVLYDAEREPEIDE
ncbi:MAG TPA: DUF2272 domain-containing protein [Stellaceae bacterium]|nr:DUF2272 domain-containing protein [Stellaceae bacterium]